MKSKDCQNCPEYKRCKDSYVSWLFFIVGLVATVAMRVVTVLMHLNPVYGKVAWYTGVGGFFLFFVYKFRVNHARSKAIRQRDLVDKIRDRRELKEEDYHLVSAILCGISSNKERINYFFIFGLSAVALALAVYIDFIK